MQFGSGGSVAIAFLLINVAMGTDQEVVDDLKKVEGVKEVYGVFGIYDLIAMIEGPDMDSLKQTIFNRVRRHEKVRRTLTLTVME